MLPFKAELNKQTGETKHRGLIPETIGNLRLAIQDWLEQTGVRALRIQSL